MKPRFTRGRSALTSTVAALLLTTAAASHAADTSLSSIVNKVHNSQSITQQEASRLQDAARSNELKKYVPKTKADAFAKQAARYDLEGVEAAASSYAAGDYRLAGKLKKAPPASVSGGHEDEYLSDVDYFANEQDNNQREGSKLVVLDRNNEIMRAKDPVAGSNLENVAYSCFYNTGGIAEKTPPQRQGVDMLLLDDPVVTGILHSSTSRTRRFVEPFSITRMAMDWDNSDHAVQAYIYGTGMKLNIPLRKYPKGYDGYRETHKDYERVRYYKETTEPRWFAYQCSFKQVRYEEPVYAPFESLGWPEGEPSKIAPGGNNAGGTPGSGNSDSNSSNSSSDSASSCSGYTKDRLSAKNKPLWEKWTDKKIAIKRLIRVGKRVVGDDPENWSKMSFAHWFRSSSSVSSLDGWVTGGDSIYAEGHIKNLVDKYVTRGDSYSALEGALVRWARGDDPYRKIEPRLDKLADSVACDDDSSRDSNSGTSGSSHSGSDNSPSNASCSSGDTLKERLPASERGEYQNVIDRRRALRQITNIVAQEFYLNDPGYSKRSFARDLGTERSARALDKRVANNTPFAEGSLLDDVDLFLTPGHSYRDLSQRMSKWAAGGNAFEAVNRKVDEYQAYCDSAGSSNSGSSSSSNNGASGGNSGSSPNDGVTSLNSDKACTSGKYLKDRLPSRLAKQHSKRRNQIKSVEMLIKVGEAYADQTGSSKRRFANYFRSKGQVDSLGRFLDSSIDGYDARFIKTVTQKFVGLRYGYRDLKKFLREWARGGDPYAELNRNLDKYKTYCDTH